jgi:hypothetical protein
LIGNENCLVEEAKSLFHQSALQAEEVMKKHIAGLFGFALLLGAASAHAQISQTVRVQVPFPF